ncbi:MAG: hypothetical protein ACLRIL_11430 [Fusicatenibacter saccharivorans]
MRKKRPVGVRHTVRPANVHRVVKVTLNGVQNQPVLTGFHIDEIIQRKPDSFEAPWVMMTGISRRTGSLEFNGKINSEYKITTS